MDALKVTRMTNNEWQLLILNCSKLDGNIATKSDVNMHYVQLMVNCGASTYVS